MSKELRGMKSVDGRAAATGYGILGAVCLTMWACSATTNGSEDVAALEQGLASSWGDSGVIVYSWGGYGTCGDEGGSFNTYCMDASGNIIGRGSPGGGFSDGSPTPVSTDRCASIRVQSLSGPNGCSAGTEGFNVTCGEAATRVTTQYPAPAGESLVPATCINPHIEMCATPAATPDASTGG